MVFYGGRVGIILVRTFVSGILIMSISTACNKKNTEPEIVDNPQEAVWKLNKNVEGLKSIAAGIAAADSVAIFSIQYNEDGSVMKIGADDPCPCGSGKKYKKCCGKNA